MEGFEKTPERDLEKDRRTFIEAVSSLSVEAVLTDFDAASSQSLDERLAATKLFILGETHGVKENADVIYTLFKKFGFRQLALEWEPELKSVAEKYAASGELDFAVIKDSPDGRITAGHFALIKKLQTEGLLDKFICFDEGGSADWDGRDENMAKHILANLSERPMLVVAGNLHAQTGSVTFDDDPQEHHPMGERVKIQIPTVPSGSIEYRRGQFYNYGVKDLGEPAEGTVRQAAFYLTNDRYVFELPEAHPAIVPNPHERL